MKNLILIATFLFSSAVFAANTQWSDLELYERYTLKQDIVFDNGITFKAGYKFDVFDSMLGGGIPLIYFEMHYTGCKNPNQTSEMILVDIKIEGQRDSVIGAQLSEGCNIAIFVEPADYYKQSIFAE
jgi:hypothetical protein